MTSPPTAQPELSESHANRPATSVEPSQRTTTVSEPAQEKTRTTAAAIEVDSPLTAPSAYDEARRILEANPSILAWIARAQTLQDLEQLKSMLGESKASKAVLAACMQQREEQSNGQETVDFPGLANLLDLRFVPGASGIAVDRDNSQSWSSRQQ